MSARGDLAVVIPARNESDRISATVRAASSIPGVDIVVVVDDGSVDGTGAQAAHAGAIVARHARNRGKAAAMETGAEAVKTIELQHASQARPSRPATHRHLLFLDADLAETAADAGPLTEPVLAGQADMTIAVFAARQKRGGHGLVLGLAGAGIQRATGWRPAEPLNGQRCITRAAFEAARPLAGGWGVEAGLTIDLLRQGMRIAEVQVPLTHRATGKDLTSQVHRAHQLADVARALVARKPWRRPPPGSGGSGGSPPRVDTSGRGAAWTDERSLRGRKAAPSSAPTAGAGGSGGSPPGRHSGGSPPRVDTA